MLCQDFFILSVNPFFIVLLTAPLPIKNCPFMPKVIAVHSYRGGTGKSNFTANLAAEVALRGYRVGVVDTDMPSPGIHNLFLFGP